MSSARRGGATFPQAAHVEADMAWLV